MRFNANFIFAPLFLVLCSLGCTKNNPIPTDKGEYPPTSTNSDAPATGKSAPTMTASFKQANDGVDAYLKISGLEPNSQHGIHIHIVGECYGPDFKSAGDHFNPKAKNHGGPGQGDSHLGDLGNITADSNGTFTGNIKIKDATSDGPNGILRRSLIVHQKQDDLKSQPAGDSGDRIACVVINTVD